MKKFTQILLVVFVAFACVLNVSAKGNDSLLNYAKQSHKIAGENVRLSNGDVLKIERFLNSNELSDDDANNIIAKCNEIVAIMDKEGVSDVNKLNKNVKIQVFNLAKEAAAYAGVTLTYNNTDKEIVAYKGNERIDVFSLNPYLKQTGNNYAVVIGATVAFIALVVVMRKKNA